MHICVKLSAWGGFFLTNTFKKTLMMTDGERKKQRVYIEKKENECVFLFLSVRIFSSLPPSLVDTFLTTEWERSSI